MISFSGLTEITLTVILNCHPPRPVPLEIAFMAITKVPKYACETKNYIYWVRNKKTRTPRNSPITKLDSFLYILSSMINQNFDSNSSSILAPPPLPGSPHGKADLLPPGLRDGPRDLLSDTGSGLSPPQRASRTSFGSTAFMLLPRRRLPLSSPWPSWDPRTSASSRAILAIPLPLEAEVPGKPRLVSNTYFYVTGRCCGSTG